MKKHLFLLAAISAWSLVMVAQPYQVPVSEAHEPMKTGKFQPTWESLSDHVTPE